MFRIDQSIIFLKPKPRAIDCSEGASTAKKKTELEGISLLVSESTDVANYIGLNAQKLFSQSLEINGLKLEKLKLAKLLNDVNDFFEINICKNVYVELGKDFEVADLV